MKKLASLLTDQRLTDLSPPMNLTLISCSKSEICHNLCDIYFYEFCKLHKSRYNLRQYSLTVKSFFHSKHEQPIIIRGCLTYQESSRRFYKNVKEGVT